MDVLTERQHRALAFIAAANQGGAAPTAEELHLWLADPIPRRTGGVMASMAQPSVGALASLFGVSESTADHLVRVRWVRRLRGGLMLTPLGLALMRSADGGEEAADRVVVLKPEDPLAYARLVSQVSDLGEAAILVDPYLDVDQLFKLTQSTGIMQILIGNHDRTKKMRTAIKAYLEGLAECPCEVRTSADLHDRLIVAEDGRVWTLGSSFSGVAKSRTFTVLTPLPGAAAEAVNDYVHRLWADAEVLVGRSMQPLETGSDAIVGEQGSDGSSRGDEAWHPQRVEAGDA